MISFKNTHIRTHIRMHEIKKKFKCELSDFAPKSKLQRETHLLLEHFMEKMSNYFPKHYPHKCISDECVFQTNDKYNLQEHFIRQHNILEKFMKEELDKKLL